MAIGAITVWTSQQILTSTALNGNFSTIRDYYNANTVELTGNQTVAGVKTFSSAITGSAGAAITGNSTITGTLGVTSTLTASNALVVTTGGLTVTAGGLTVTAGGLVVTAGGLTVSAGGVTVTGNSQFNNTVTFSVAPVFSADISVTGKITCTDSAILGLATSLGSGATDGFVYIPTTANAPGTPTAAGTRSAMYYDPNTNKLRVYDTVDAAWKEVVLA